MQITLPRLPYPYDALAPHISRTMLEIHHGKHHRAHVEKAKTRVFGAKDTDRNTAAALKEYLERQART